MLIYKTLKVVLKLLWFFIFHYRNASNYRVHLMENIRSIHFAERIVSFYVNQ